MNRIALNIICKNEAHIITRMLSSALPLIDMIVAIDTGSSDDTIQIIKAFGEKNNRPTYIFERPFDNFCNSRNYALEKLKEVVGQLSWPSDCTFGFNVDCDEIVQILPAFNKQYIEHDMLVLLQRIGRETFTRQGIYRLSKSFTWKSPVHEELKWTDPTITKKVERNIVIVEEPMGASWKGDLVQKFLRYAAILKAYYEEGNHDFRTVFFMGDSYNAAASYSQDPAQAQEYFRIAQEYFDHAKTIVEDSRQVKAMLYKKMAENTQAMGAPWHVIKGYYLSAYNAHPFKAESLAHVIEHYLSSHEGEPAYYYARYTYCFFAQFNNTTETSLYIDEALYNWKLLFYYYRAAMMSGRTREGKALFKTLKDIQRKHPEYFEEADLVLINIHSPLGSAILRLKEALRRPIRNFHKMLPPSDQSLKPLPKSAKEMHATSSIKLKNM